MLSDLLQRARAGTTLARQLVQRPPWSMTFAEQPALGIVTVLGGPAWITVEGGSAAERTGRTGPAHSVPSDNTEDVAGPPGPGRLGPGDIALVSRVARFTIADDPATPPQFIIRGRTKQFLGDAARADSAARLLAPRTYGDGLPGATTMLRGACELRGDVGEHLLDLLPPLAIVRDGPRTRAAVDLLAAEVARDEPGQDAVLNRLLDLLLVVALRAWCAGPHAEPPAWYRALSDPVVGPALRLLHDDPARRWTVAALADEVGLSRAAFAARFTSLVARPPLTYLTDWRMTLAADLLRSGDATIAAVAREVGYSDVFAFSVAFKRARGASPSAWRRTEGAGIR